MMHMFSGDGDKKDKKEEGKEEKGGLLDIPGVGEVAGGVEAVVDTGADLGADAVATGTDMVPDVPGAS